MLTCTLGVRIARLRFRQRPSISRGRSIKTKSKRAKTGFIGSSRLLVSKRQKINIRDEKAVDDDQVPELNRDQCGSEGSFPPFANSTMRSDSGSMEQLKNPFIIAISERPTNPFVCGHDIDVSQSESESKKADLSLSDISVLSCISRGDKSKSNEHGGSHPSINEKTSSDKSQDSSSSHGKRTRSPSNDIDTIAPLYESANTYILDDFKINRRALNEKFTATINMQLASNPYADYSKVMLKYLEFAKDISA